MLIWIINICLNILIGKTVYNLLYDKESIYECGLQNYNILNKLKNYMIRYYLIVIVFIIFEIEIILLYPILFTYNITLLTNFIIFIIFIILGIIIDILYQLL